MWSLPVFWGVVAVFGENYSEVKFVCSGHSVFLLPPPSPILKHVSEIVEEEQVWDVSYEALKNSFASEVGEPSRVYFRFMREVGRAPFNPTVSASPSAPPHSREHQVFPPIPCLSAQPLQGALLLQCFFLAVLTLAPPGPLPSPLFYLFLQSAFLS